MIVNKFKTFFFSGLLIFSLFIIATNSIGDTIDDDVKAYSSSTVHYVSVEGVVNPVMSEYLIKSISDAEDAQAELVVIEIDTPGGLDLSMRDIIKKILASDVPVIVYVAPSGSRAASAGVFITYSAHLGAMAPGTNIGSAHPVAMGGEMDETMVKKVENDAVAYIKGLADKRGKNVEWAEAAVRESVNVTAKEALELNVIDFVAENRADLFKQAHGKTITLDNGKTVTLNLENVNIVEVEMNARFRFLKALSDPNIAYILMMIGMAGLYFELSNPGAIFPGVIGAICLIIAFYALQTLPVNYAGLALIALGLIFFVLELMVTSFGLLTIAGAASLLLGSIMLIDSPEPYMRVSLALIIPTVTVITAGFAFLVYYIIKEVRSKHSVTGEEGIIGHIGTAESEINLTGKVFVDGEYWNAESAEPISAGREVRVVAIEGLKIKVEEVSKLEI